MLRKKSEKYFHAIPEQLNCAQAVLKGFQKEFDITDQEIEEFRAWGGDEPKGEFVELYLQQNDFFLK